MKHGCADIQGTDATTGETSLVVGRDTFVTDLVDRMIAGQSVVIYAAPGIGKTTVLAATSECLLRRGIPCAMTASTSHAIDVTRALGSAYPGIASDLPQRIIRGRLRDAAQERPGALLLDHFQARGPAVKGVLRSLRGTGLGVVVAFDTFSERDHAALRAMCLSSIELQVPPLARRHQRKLWLRWTHARGISLSDADTDLVLDLAEGRPGYLTAMASLLADRSRWNGSRPMVRACHVDVIAKLALSCVTPGMARDPR